MKKNIMVLLLAAFALGHTAWAQETKGNAETQTTSGQVQENIQKRAKSLAKEFGLKDEARDRFTALYTQYSEELRQARAIQNASLLDVARRRQAEGKQQGEEVQLSDEESHKIILAGIQSQREVAEIQLRYYNSFRKMLTPAQCFKIFGPRAARRGDSEGQRGNNRSNFNRDSASGGAPRDFGGGLGGFGNGF